MTRPDRPLHIGIYGDYGFTPRPDEGIGVFLFNLIDGLLELESQTRITLWVHPGEEHRLQRLLSRHGEAVQVYPPADRRLLGRWLDGIEDLQHGLQVVLLGRTSDRVQHWLLAAWKSLGPDSVRSIGGLVKLAGLVLLCGIALPAIWCIAVAYHLLVNGLLRALALPAELLLGSRDPDAPLPPLPPCDVWLVPHGRTQVTLNAPEIVILWDVAHHHVSGVFGSEVQELTDQLFFQRARRAAIICCASQAVLEQDLRRLFPWAESRLRVVPLAPPRDLTDGPRERFDVRRRFGLCRQYLFYPAAIRAHKNHATLIRALAWLRWEQDLDLELVCTGKGAQSPRLQALLSETGMSEHVKFLGLIDRSAIAALYRQAALTVVPSLHEGYGLPVLEAMACGCPVASADLPTLRELLAGHEAAVAFFDPRDPAAIGTAIVQTLQHREHFLKAQQAAFAELTQRNWQHVAADYLRLFHDAVEGVGHGELATASAMEAFVHA
jgi:glycosyltransferase involved in cell wall biosynthesis